jgi:DNA repair protein RecO (recombination protein O)
MLVKTEAIVLKSMKYGETSKIVTLYSREYGKISCIAKGARSAKNKFGSSLEPLTRSQVVFYKKEHRDLHLISQCDAIRTFKNVGKDFDLLTTGFAIAEFLYRVTHNEEKNPLLFDLLTEVLTALDGEPRTPMIHLHAFRLRTAMISGYSPELNFCSTCEKELAAGSGEYRYAFQIARGAVFCNDCMPPEGTSTAGLSSQQTMASISAPALQILRRCASAAACSLNSIVVDQKMGNELEEILFLYLQYHFEQYNSMKSLELMQHYSK